MRRRRRPELDITPLIDVLFMLIIFFVLTANFLQGRIEVDLPVGEAVAKTEENSLLLTVRKDGSVLWGDRETRMEELAPLAAEAAAARRDILLAGDREAPYGAVAEVLDVLRREGIVSTGLALQGDGAR